MTGRTPDPTVGEAAPAIEILIDGRSVAAADLATIRSVDVRESVNDHATAVIKVRSPESPFIHGQPIDVRMGHGADIETVFSGVVTGRTIRHKANRSPEVTVTAHARSIHMDQARRDRSGTDISETDLIATIAEEHGLAPEFIGELPSNSEGVLVHSATDWQHIVAMAKRNGMVAYVREQRLIIDDMSTGSPVAKLAVGADLSSLTVTEDLSNAVDPSGVMLWDPDRVEIVEAHTSAADVAAPGSHPALTDAIAAAGWPPAAEVLGLAATGDEQRARELSRGIARIRQVSYPRASGTMPGRPGIRIGTWIALAGLGEGYRGVHFVSRTRHRFTSSGYRVEFDVGTTPSESAADSCGCARAGFGIVVDASDPMGWGRVKVRLPWMTDAPEHWARRVVPDAGPDRGMWFTPEIGDEVWVEFEEGDLSKPIVVGSVWNGSAGPPGDGDTEARVIKTRSGHTVALHDGDATLEVSSAGGQKMSINDGDSSIRLEDSSGNSVTLEAGGITISSSGDVTIRAGGEVQIEAGTNVDIAAQVSVKAEGTASLDLTTGGVLRVAGSLVQIN